MSKPITLRRLSEDRGATAIEFAIIFMLMIAITLGIIEYGMMLFQWNASEKATHLAVRYAVVSDPVAAGIKVIGTQPVSSDYGVACVDPDSMVVNSDCWFAPLVCTLASPCATSDPNYSAETYTASFNAIVARAQAVAPFIKPENIQIEYRFSGLGFVGKPGGQPVAVTVRLVNMTFDLMVIDNIFDIEGSIPMPSFAATLISEDQKTTGI